MPVSKKKDMPGTLRRSPAKAQRTYAKAHDSAAETYGDGESAHRAAHAALKHSFEKRGDHWVPKNGKGPSDPQAKKSTPASRRRPSKTYGGVDVEGNSKQELYERAKQYGITGRSRMSKLELAEAIAKKQKSNGRKR
jgi:cation transport regulator ChaB